MQWEMGLQIEPGMYFVWGAATGGVRAAEILMDGRVVYFQLPNPIVYANNNDFAVSQNISHWFGPVRNPFGGNT